ncbi:hypothetical protein, partial [Phenylobacterium sp.]|uniref:hypothetical protein n=1 Tax=Phenylobacterium sp. TaxID=1871053 RepID=UPI0035B1F87A
RSEPPQTRQAHPAASNRNSLRRCSLNPARGGQRSDGGLFQRNRRIDDNGAESEVWFAGFAEHDRAAHMREPDFEGDGWCLDDGEELHREAPSKFWIPSADERERLQPGDHAKLIFRISIDNDEAPVDTQLF